MHDMRDIVNEIRAVTVSRENGSGGSEIAARLAKRLGWQVIDHELVARVACALGTSQEEAAAHVEHTEGVLVRIRKEWHDVPTGLRTDRASDPHPRTAHPAHHHFDRDHALADNLPMEKRQSL